jgi:hypothetical protein
LVAAIRVRKIHPWAVVPQKPRADRSGAREEAALLEAHFKYHRKFRAKELCPPWVLGHELGWTIASPITEILTPIQDVQIAEDIDPAEAGRAVDATEFWNRGRGYIGARKNHWTRSYVYRSSTGGWEAMFLPNGDGTVEWHLGWGVQIPEDYFLLIQGLDGTPGLEIPTGILTSKQANDTWDGIGVSIAVKPAARVAVRRGEPVARMALLHRDTLQARLETE